LLFFMLFGIFWFLFFPSYTQWISPTRQII
jgi:hypothetical protein